MEKDKYNGLVDSSIFVDVSKLPKLMREDIDLIIEAALKNDIGSYVNYFSDLEVMTKNAWGKQMIDTVTANNILKKYGRNYYGDKNSK